MPIPNRDRELLEASGFEIRETDSSYHVVPRGSPSHYPRIESGELFPAAVYLKCQQVPDCPFWPPTDSPVVEEYRGQVLRVLGLTTCDSSTSDV